MRWEAIEEGMVQPGRQKNMVHKHYSYFHLPRQLNKWQTLGPPQTSIWKVGIISGDSNVFSISLYVSIFLSPTQTSLAASSMRPGS
jgi:hypothetical protein